MDGKCVRLTQGDYSKGRTYSDSPLETAKMFEDCGASMLHLVDLDGARSGSPKNLGVLEDIASCTSLKVQFGGGIKSGTSLDSAFNAGAYRIVCGSIACTDPETFISWIGKYSGGRIVLGADVRDGKVAVNGWLDSTSLTPEELFGFFLPHGLKTAAVTDISRDGMLSGPAVELYRRLADSFPDLEITASGGVASLADIEALARAGLSSVIVGKALYEGRISLRELAEACAGNH